MATAGGAKMEPASCVKQSSPEVPCAVYATFLPGNVTVWRGDEEAGRARERDVTSARRAAPRTPEVSGMSFISSD